MHTDCMRLGSAPAALGTVPLLLGLVMLLSSPVGAVEEQKGSISGTVRDSAGKPAVGLVLRLEQDIPRVAGKGAEGGRGGGGTKVIARATTDSQGKFSMSNLPPGAYRLIAGSKNVGWIYLDVTVEAGRELKLDDLALAKTD